MFQLQARRTNIALAITDRPIMCVSGAVRNSFASKALLLILVLAECIGCAPRSKSIYRLTKLDADYFLLSPVAPLSKDDRQTIRIPRSGQAQVSGDTATADCSIRGSWFTFSKAPGSSLDWIAQTPSLTQWQQTAGTVDMKEEWQTFERSLNELQQNRCFASQDEYLLVKQRIATGISVPADDTLFYRYGFGPGGYVDLAPGMRLRIYREYFGPHANNQPSSASFEGTSITDYEVLDNGESGTRLGFLNTEKRAMGPTAFATNPLDNELGAHFAVSIHLRLFLENLTVSGDVKSPAILIGASTDEDMNEASKEIENNAEVSCEALEHLHVTCVRFDGTVTVSPMLQIFVNGSVTYVPIGSKLWFVLPHTPGLQQTALFRTLRVQRLFRNKEVDVQFTHDTEGASQVLLVGGDKVSWSKRAESKGSHKPPDFTKPPAPIGAF
jgi:hypothetical protein